MRSVSKGTLAEIRVALLDHLVITEQGNPSLYQGIRRHERELQAWFGRFPSWHLLLHRGVARLHKAPTLLGSGPDFFGFQQPQDFVCFTLALWFWKAAAVRALDVDIVADRFLMSALAESVCSVTAENGTPLLDFNRHSDRLSMLRALRFLERIGALEPIHGSAEDWVNKEGDQDVLYRFTEAAERLAMSVEAPLIRRILDSDPTPLEEPPVYPHLSTEQRAWRGLLLGPALMRQDDSEAFAYVAAHRDAVGQELYDALGWILDIRRDYATAIRSDRIGHGQVNLLHTRPSLETSMLLLICTAIREQVEGGRFHPNEHGTISMTYDQWHHLLLRVRHSYGMHWGRTGAKFSQDEYIRRATALAWHYGILRGPDRERRCLITPLAARMAGRYGPDLPLRQTTRSTKEGLDGQSKLL